MKEDDIDDFLRVDRLTFQRYIDEYPDYFGGKYKPEIGADWFHKKIKLTFFKKLMLNDEVVGFMNYDQKEYKIYDISVRIIEKAQNRGIGTLFISHLIKLSKKFHIPIYIEAIKTNPVQNLYKRLGFEFYKPDEDYKKDMQDYCFFFAYNL
ncbi:MAG: GNAT family N-acetyltransferase [Synergistaceae bacterium]|nr:GNAT family N-acetyltransferase [Synergistaceae bacterium]